MILTVVAGYREFFAPRPLDHAALASAVTTIGRDGELVRAGWATVAGGGAYHGFLYDEPGAADDRVDLFLDYLEDSAGPGHHAVVVLPFDSLLDGGVADARTGHFVARAQARLGDDRVRCRRIVLSVATARTLERLAAARPGPDAKPDLDARDPLITAIDLEAALGRGPAFEAMQLNYGCAILSLGRALVMADSVFGVAVRPDDLADALAEGDLRIRVELSADRLLKEFERGGELWGLLSRPLPPRASQAEPLTGPKQP